MVPPSGGYLISAAEKLKATAKDRLHDRTRRPMSPRRRKAIAVLLVAAGVGGVIIWIALRMAAGS